MIGKRGQAFDTFKLMIAAVIAVAILGILLAILGGLIFPGQDPATMIESQLQQAVQYPRSVFVSQTEADFKAGVLYSQDSFTDILGGMGTVTFHCSTSFDSTQCSASATDNTVTIGANFKAVVIACCDVDKNCDVGIGAGSVTNC